MPVTIKPGIFNYKDNQGNFQTLEAITGTDNTLSIEGAAADAKVTGDELSQLKNSISDRLIPYDITDGYMRVDGTILKIPPYSNGRLIKYKLTGLKNFLRNSIYIEGDTSFDVVDSNNFCVLWFVKNSALMPSQYINVDQSPDYYNMREIIIPNGAEEVWVDARISIYLYDLTKKATEKIDIINSCISNKPQTWIMLRYNIYDRRFVWYANGQISEYASFGATGFVDISGFQKILYKKLSTKASELYAGIAFYDSAFNYLSGVPTALNMPTNGYVWETVSVPNGAHFVRFSTRSDTATYGNFEAYGTNPFLESIADVTGGHWRGKTWYAYGTSITSVHEGTGKYPTYLAQMSGLNLFEKGIGGGGIGDLGAYSKGQVYNAICNTNDGKLNADLITLETGANDCNASVPLGTIYDTGTETLAGCLNDCIRYLQANTNAQICVFNSPATTTEPNAANKYYEWAEMVEKICHINRVHFLRNDNNMGYAKLASSNGSMYVVDNIHQTDLGGYIMAQNLWNQIRNIPLFYIAIPT